MYAGAASGKFVARVAAADRDGGDAGRVACVLDATLGARMFSLLPVAIADGKAEYRLMTGDEAEFDRELVDRHRVRVMCTDRGSPPLSTSADLEVVVDDINDNEPRLSRQRYVFRVAEDVSPATQIGTIAASDPDQGPNGSVSFYLEPKDSGTSESEVIEIHPDSGVVSVTAGWLLHTVRLLNTVKRGCMVCYQHSVHRFCIAVVLNSHINNLLT